VLSVVRGGGTIAGTVAAVGFADAWPLAGLAAASAALGLTAVGWNGVYLAEVSRAVPIEKVGLATGGVLMFTFVGVVLGPSTFGAIVAMTGSYTAAFIAMDVLVLATVVALVAPDAGPATSATLNALAEAAPRGTLEDLHVSAPVTDRIGLEHSRASGRFTGLGLGAEAGPVAVDGASGRFEASGPGVFADVAAGRLRVNVSDRLEQPLRGGHLAGGFAAVPTSEGVRWPFGEASLATRAGTVTATGWLLTPRDGGAPELDVALSLGATRITAVRDLVGTLLMPEPALRWFERAAPFGDVRVARVALRGRLPDAPGGGEGTFEATATLFVPVFSYVMSMGAALLPYITFV